MSLAEDIAARRGKPLSAQEQQLIAQSIKLQKVLDRRASELNTH